MDTAIVYCSQTGHTETYAKWLAESLGCTAIPYAQRGSVQLDAVGTLVFCSWLHASSLKGSPWLKKAMTEHPDLDVVVLFTGATPHAGHGHRSPRRA